MSITTIANRYAKALADVIMERGQTLTVADEIKAFTQIVEENSELRNVFDLALVAAVERGLTDPVEQCRRAFVAAHGGFALHIEKLDAGDMLVRSSWRHMV